MTLPGRYGDWLATRLWRRPAPFRSNEEFFQTVTDLITKLEAGGHGEAAAELREGYGRLNGLTDGFALFLDSIEKVRAAHSMRFAPEEQTALARIRRAVHGAVYRR